MKRLVAFLLTLALLLGMVGTVSVAADAAVAKIPEYTATIAKDGTVTVTLADGIKDYAKTGDAYAYVLKLDKDGNEDYASRVKVELEYDSSKKAYIGKDEAAAGGKFVFDEIELSKETEETGKKGLSRTLKSVEFKASYEKGAIYNAEYNTASLELETDKKEGREFVAAAEYDESSKGYWTKIGKLAYESHDSGKTTGDKNGSTSKGSSERKDYEQYKGNYIQKTVVESESKDVYSKKLGEFVFDSSKSTTKIYNAEDILTDSEEENITRTYNKAETEFTDATDTTTKDYSSKGYLRSTDKTTENQQFVKVTGTIGDEEVVWWVKKDKDSSEKKTNTDGVVTYTKKSAKVYGKDGKSYKDGTTQIYYNAYTGKVTRTVMTDTEYAENKKTEKWETTSTTTRTYNNDDGSRRYKTVATYVNGIETKETHYDKNNKVAAEMTYNKDNNVLAWTDANGKVIGRTQGTYENGTVIEDVSFKKRTGALDSWTITDYTTDKEGTKTTKTLWYDEGKKSNVFQTVDSEDSYKEYINGVLVYNGDKKKAEAKQYDYKGNLISSRKWDEDDEVTKYYNSNNKLIKTIGLDTDDETVKLVTKHYNPATGKVTKSEVDYSTEDGKYVTDHLDAKNNVLWSEKDFYDEDEKAWVTGYYNEKGKEFARTFGYYDNKTDVDYDQHLYGKMDYENATGAVEKSVSWTDRDYQTMTETTSNLKWTVTNGKAGTPLKRKDQTVTTWDKDKTEVNEYVGGVLTKNQVIERNDYYKLNTTPYYYAGYDRNNIAKETVKEYDWYTGKMTDMYKNIYPDQQDSPYYYHKNYDKYGNLQTYSEINNTDQWNWWHTYYMTGTLKTESWEDRLDYDYDLRGPVYDSSYIANYYLDGTLASKETTARNGQNIDGHVEAYNSDGSYSYWADTVGGVTNAWLYNSDGVLTGYKWNEKYQEKKQLLDEDEDPIETYEYSYEMWDENSTLLYNYTEYTDYDQVLGGTNVTEIKTDPAGNKWEKKSDANGDTTVTVTLKNKNNGWQYAVGEWFYVEKGAPVKEAWRQIDGGWYYFDENAMMVTGLVKVKDQTFAANDDGRVTRGWVAWEDGNGDVKWSYTNDNGEVQTGWKNIGGKWYYFTDGWYQNTDETQYREDVVWKQSANRGVMATGAVKVWNSDWTDTHTYFFNEDGTWDNSPGWKKAGDNIYGDIEWHYYNKDGVEVTGWNNIGGKWYYFNEDGVMKNGWVKSGNNWYFMNRTDGSLATNGWVEDVYEGWYYMDKNGQYQTGWLKDGNNWYYLKGDGAMASKEWAKYDNKWYFMGSDGSMTTGWQKDHDKWYYMSKDGSMKSNSWEGSGNTWYYLGEDGAMLTDTDKTIDGKVYHFDENGLCTNPY